MTLISLSSRQPHESVGDICQHQSHLDALRRSLNQVLLGKDHVVERVLACLLARGHLLLDDLPGLGKTTLAKAVAHAVGGKFARIQCTPDLLPTDITGFNMFNQQSREFEFMPGPVFSDVLLADEVNRATPRTQSALFEAMAERQVTIDGRARKLPATFFVIATQNPVDSHGAYPLPEAQLDRFAMKLRIGYPGRTHELAMLQEDAEGRRDRSEVEAVMTPGTLFALQEHVRTVFVTPKLQEYLVDLGAATRAHPAVTLGVSPRGLLTWQRTAQAWAHLHGRDFVTPEDIHDVAVPVLEVRLFGEFDDSLKVIEQILHQVAAP